MINSQKTGKNLYKQESNRNRSHENIQTATEDQIRSYMDHISANTTRAMSGRRVKAMHAPQSDYIMYATDRTSKEMINGRVKKVQMPSHMTSRMSRVRKNK